jgi:hypothetical protein
MTELAQAIEDARVFVTRYVVLTPEQADACALWVVHTHAVDAADVTPYLSVSSAEKRSGKSLLLEVLGAIVHKPWPTVRPSEAVLFRQIEKERPTLLLDEVDTIWNPRARSEDEGLRALLNAGFRRRGSTVPRCSGPSMKVRNFATFCPKALGGIGDLPDTIADRCIPIRMERKRGEDTVERWRWRVVEPFADAVRESIHGAVSALCALLEETEPELPDALSDRAQDAWEPLFAIADVAGCEWPLRARYAALSLMTERVDEPPIGARLLADVRGVFNGDARLSTTDLIDVLAAIEDAPWGDWGGKPLTGRRLAALLRPYSIKPRNEGGFRGYFASDFTDAWSRYAPSPDDSPQSALSAPSAPLLDPDEYMRQLDDGS